MERHAVPIYQGFIYHNLGEIAFPISSKTSALALLHAMMHFVDIDAPIDDSAYLQSLHYLITHEKDFYFLDSSIRKSLSELNADLCFLEIYHPSEHACSIFSMSLEQQKNFLQYIKYTSQSMALDVFSIFEDVPWKSLNDVIAFLVNDRLVIEGFIPSNAWTYYQNTHNQYETSMPMLM